LFCCSTDSIDSTIFPAGFDSIVNPFITYYCKSAFRKILVAIIIVLGYSQRGHPLEIRGICKLKIYELFLGGTGYSFLL